MIIDQSFKNFITDVQAYYTYTDSYIDGNYNIVLIIKGLKFNILSEEIKPYYEGYIKSKTPRETMINRAVTHLVELAKNCEKNCL